MDETSNANNEDPGPVKSSDAQRVTGNENKEAGDEPQEPARQDPPPGRTPTDDE